MWLSQTKNPLNGAHLLLLSRSQTETYECVDLTKLNQAVKRELYKTLTVESTIGSIEEGGVYSKLDANSGFHQVPDMLISHVSLYCIKLTREATLSRNILNTLWKIALNSWLLRRFSTKFDSKESWIISEYSPLSEAPSRAKCCLSLPRRDGEYSENIQLSLESNLVAKRRRSQEFKAIFQSVFQNSLIIHKFDS